MRARMKNANEEVTPALKCNHRAQRKRKIILDIRAWQTEDQGAVGEEIHRPVNSTHL